MDARKVDHAGFDELLRELVAQGHELIGPTERDGAIVFDRIVSRDDLPHVVDHQGRGSYRLSPNLNGRIFSFASGPDSAKRFLFPARELLQKVTKRDGRLRSEEETGTHHRYAFVGLRACDLQAIAIQDRIFMAGPAGEPRYSARRRDAFLIGVDCAEPAGNCFCVSMGSGPRCEASFDLALTEIDGGFVVRGGSAKGERLLAAIPSEPVTAAVMAKAEAVTARARTKMGRALDTSDLPGLLLGNREHPRWQEVADICLACGNCTAVCPTCFCHDVTDGIDLTGTEATRTREWASCFSVEFSHTAGGDVRASGAARYRQWLSHKFATWFEQFGTSGCVGCGRCITWCPVGIDVTEEIELIRAGGEAG